MKTTQLKPDFTATLGDQKVKLSWLTPLIVIPTHMVPEVQVWMPTINALHEQLEKNSLATAEYPWLVSSIVTDMFGNLRADSKAHKGKMAIDLAPLYNVTTLTDEDKTNPHLATDILKLSLLSLLKLPVAAVVEGDHLHCVAVASPNLPYLFSYPTYQRWYALGNDIPSVWSGKLLKKLFVYDPALLTLSPASEAQKTTFQDLFVASVTDEAQEAKK